MTVSIPDYEFQQAKGNREMKSYTDFKEVLIKAIGKELVPKTELIGLTDTIDKTRKLKSFWVMNFHFKD